MSAPCRAVAPDIPNCAATRRHWNGIRPNVGSTASVMIASGLVAATSSIDMPPARAGDEHRPPVVPVHGQSHVHLGGNIRQLFHQHAVNGNSACVRLVRDDARTQQPTGKLAPFVG